jgi:hypothetical protein
MVGGHATLGHAVRDGTLPPPTANERHRVVIAGAGVAGLAAARQLERNNIRDVVLIELADSIGGTSNAGANATSAFPWAAHYVPIASEESTEVRRWFEECGVITGYDATGAPRYREDYLCSDPPERLFLHGRWQEGVVPQLGVTPADQRQVAEFFHSMERFKHARGADGHRAFVIPLDASSRDPAFTRLDQISMAEFMRGRNWTDCAPLRWYVDYCCRDDYGAGIEQVSAWAAIHYFAARNARAANAPEHAVLTWPEGNGWLTQRLHAGLHTTVRTSCAVWRVEQDSGEVRVDCFDAQAGKTTRITAEGLIWCAPQFVARRVVRDVHMAAPVAPEQSWVYSPWMVANLTLDTLPAGPGAALAWDNVDYTSRSLGYVVATHQHLHPVPKRTVITYYQPLDHLAPQPARHQALSRSYTEWCEQILDDLARTHPDIERHVTHLDVCVWGHGMVRPVPGFIWGADRARFQQPLGRIHFAHSDVSGISIFEEAYTRGVRCADALARRLAAVGTG